MQFFGGRSPFGDDGDGPFGSTFMMGGMGGGGPFSFGMGSMGGMAQGMAQGMGQGVGAGMKRGGPRKDPPVEHALNLSLEELYSGTTKKMKISRKVRLAGMHRVGRGWLLFVAACEWLFCVLCCWDPPHFAMIMRMRHGSGCCGRRFRDVL